MIRKLLDVNKLFTIVFLLIYSHMKSVKLEALNQHTTTPISPLGRKRGRRRRDRRREELGERMSGIHFLFCSSECVESQSWPTAGRKGRREQDGGGLTPLLLTRSSQTQEEHHGRAPAEEDLLQAERTRAIAKEERVQTER